MEQLILYGVIGVICGGFLIFLYKLYKSNSNPEFDFNETLEAVLLLQNEIDKLYTKICELQALKKRRGKGRGN